MEYKKIFLGKCSFGFVTIEEFIGGEFIKYINNNGILCGDASDGRKKAESLAHFSYEASQKELMLLDMQGCGYQLFDPEIATKELKDNDECLFSAGNLSSRAMSTFLGHHSCSLFCTLVGLEVIARKDLTTDKD